VDVLILDAEALDRALLVAAAGFVLIALVAVIGRTRRMRQIRRVASFQRELHAYRDSPPGPRGEGFSRLARQLTATDFQELEFRGLPEDLAPTVAQALRARAGAERIRRLAAGESAASVWTRAAALEILVSSGDEHRYSALEQCLRSESPSLARSAVRLLMRTNDRPAAEILVTALRDGVLAPSRVAAAFDRMQTPRADLLEVLLDGERPAARFWGARLAGRLAAREWAAKVRALAKDDDPLVRRAAAETLGIIGDPPDRSLLLALFHDPVPMVRVHAARASAAVANEAVADALTELLADREWIVRAAARDALRSMNGLGTAAVVRTLWHPDRFAANNAAEVLHRTGAAAQAARRVLQGAGATADLVAILARYVAVGGAHLRDALLDPFEERARGLLLSRIRAADRPD
jgi:HEAT repeat protein